MEAGRKIVGSAPSTLKLMLPEIYLDDKDVDEKIGAVNENMRRYISDGILKETEPCMMLVKRATGVSP